MAILEDPNEMKLIYDTSKQVYSRMYSRTVGCKLLEGKTSKSETSLKMYFEIFACMRRGKCYKKGTSATYTRYLIENIGQDYGKDAMLIALAAAKQHSEYRASCNNEQPGIEMVCREIIATHNLKIKYEDLQKYNGKEALDKEQIAPEKMINKRDVSTTAVAPNTLKVKISIGAIVFEAEGETKTVIAQQKLFAKELLPNAISSLERAYKLNDQKTTDGKTKNGKTGRTKKQQPEKKEIPVGKRLAKKHPTIEKLTALLDFKARMIPLMYLATKDKLQTEFTIKDIQSLMYDALGEEVEKGQIEDVIKRRDKWFERVGVNPRKYKLLDVAKEYAKNVLN